MRYINSQLTLTLMVTTEISYLL